MKPSCKTCERDAAIKSACTADRRVSAPSNWAAARTSALSSPLEARMRNSRLSVLAHAAVHQLEIGGIDRHARHFQQRETAKNTRHIGHPRRPLVVVELEDVSPTLIPRCFAASTSSRLMVTVRRVFGDTSRG
jgi:hypothetical protein